MDTSEDYIWDVTRCDLGSSQLKDRLKDGWEPIGIDGDRVIIRKLVTPLEFEDRQRIEIDAVYNDDYDDEYYYNEEY